MSKYIEILAQMKADQAELEEINAVEAAIVDEYLKQYALPDRLHAVLQDAILDDVVLLNDVMGSVGKYGA